VAVSWGLEGWGCWRGAGTPDAPSRGLASPGAVLSGMVLCGAVRCGAGLSEGTTMAGDGGAARVTPHVRDAEDVGAGTHVEDGEIVDLSSDTQTRPTDAMRAAIAAAPVGDEQQRLDPTVTELCVRVAALLGQEAAVFLPSGLMCNLVAVATHTSPGAMVLVERSAHLARAEAGGSALAAGVQLEVVDGERGIFGPEAVVAAHAEPSRYWPQLGLVELEQSHNFGGGSLWPLDTYDAVVDAAHARDVPVHVDGARLMNAVVASGVSAERWGSRVDSVWIDFTKGLGAPFGAVLAGSSAFIDRAWTFKHRFGGAMRQVGMMAAGCLHALDHHVDRLADDHANLARLHAGLVAMGVAVTPPDTNILFLDPASVGREARELQAALRARGVLVSAVLGRLRIVTHLGVDAEGAERALEAFAHELGRR
jgi:threonine aldolase